jgi:hypothetical protein
MVMIPAGTASGKDPAIPITTVNYSDLPVYATAVTLDHRYICNKLGLPDGSPVSVRTRDGSEAFPVMAGTDGTGTVIRIFLSMKPLSRLDLVAERTGSWSGEKLLVARCEPAEARGEMRNGVARVVMDKDGWTLAFDGPWDSEVKAAGADRQSKAATNPFAVITKARLDFWVDNQNRGRISNAKPADLGLAHFPADARIEKCEASVSADGIPSIKVTRKMGGIAKDMTVIETFELVPGMPILICRIRWQNDGDKPLWIAYVRSGDGIAGSWSPTLMPRPLIERKKYATQGDINGGETRPSWIGGLCRISMESPATGCGAGLSTLLPTPGKVGQGSMIWGCGGSGFQCNLIDPEQGQFPFLVKPRSSLDNGNAFLITQNRTSAFRQVVEMWSALAAGKPPRLASPCAVFVDGEPLHAQTAAFLPDKPGLLCEKDNISRAALRMDFNKYYQCLVSIDRAAEQDPVEVSMRPMTPAGKLVVLLKADRPGEYRIDLNKDIKKPDEIPFVLKVKKSPAAAVKGISIAEVLPVAPMMLSPVADASVTDFATMFRWKAIPMVTDYDIQLSRSADFSSPVDIRVTSSEECPWYMPPDNKLPAPGKWFYRIRGAKEGITGEWSESRNFTVNDDHTAKPLKRPLTADNPLFTLEATRVLDYTVFHPDIPEDIARYVGIIVEGFENKGIPVTDFARGMEKLPHSLMMRSHWVSLADVEWLFRNLPNFAGMQGGEHLSSLYRGNDEMVYHHRLTKLCAKYGMFYQEADGTYADDKWQELWDRQSGFVKEYGKYLVLSQKNNIIRRQFYSQSCAMGLWLGGLTHGHGAWEDGGFYWQNAGFKEMGRCDGERSGVLSTMPRIFWDLVCVMGISRGCGIYSLDGQTLMYSEKAAARDPKGPWASSIWSDTGKTSDTFKRFVAPLIRGTVRHSLIPTKDEVLRNVKLAVYNDRKVQANVNAWPHYVEYGPLYAATYGFRKMGNIDGQLWEFFPNTGRYFFIPVLPQGNVQPGDGIRTIPVSELQDQARVRELFDTAYPKWYDGDALVIRAGDTLTVMNSRENEDVIESYSVPLKSDLLENISGKMNPQSFLVGKIEDNGRKFWFQVNTEFPERNTEVALKCVRKPDWQIDPAGAAKNATWDEAGKVLQLRLSHEQGAVEVTVK